MLTLDWTWIRQGLVAVPWVRFGGGSDDFPQKKSKRVREKKSKRVREC